MVYSQETLKLTEYSVTYSVTQASSCWQSPQGNSSRDSEREVQSYSCLWWSSPISSKTNIPFPLSHELPKGEHHLRAKKQLTPIQSTAPQHSLIPYN